MRDSYKTGFSFGLTSAIITTLGLMVGLYSGTESKIAIIGGVLTIAIADAFSDALGIHISEESKDHDSRHVWESTFSTFASKFFFAMTFVLPIWLCCLQDAVIISMAWGLSLLTLFSYYIARIKKENALNVIGEHLAIAVLVIALSYYVGCWVNATFMS